MSKEIISFPSKKKAKSAAMIVDSGSDSGQPVEPEELPAGPSIPPRAKTYKKMRTIEPASDSNPDGEESVPAPSVSASKTSSRKKPIPKFRGKKSTEQTSAHVSASTGEPVPSGDVDMEDATMGRVSPPIQQPAVPSTQSRTNTPEENTSEEEKEEATPVRPAPVKSSTGRSRNTDDEAPTPVEDGDESDHDSETPQEAPRSEAEQPNVRDREEVDDGTPSDRDATTPRPSTRTSKHGSVKAPGTAVRQTRSGHREEVAENAPPEQLEPPLEIAPRRAVPRAGSKVPKKPVVRPDDEEDAAQPSGSGSKRSTAQRSPEAMSTSKRVRKNAENDLLQVVETSMAKTAKRRAPRSQSALPSSTEENWEYGE